MLRIVLILAVAVTAIMADAETFSYRFDSTPLPKAIMRIMQGHPEIEVNFIYNELENYKTSATVDADNVYEALRQTVGANPVTVARYRDTYYLEALQHGKHIYTGQAIGSDNEPVAGATVMLLAPRDSTVVTFGITDDSGRFCIPCDSRKVIAKLSCLGYRTTYHLCDNFNIGAIIMPEDAVRLTGVKVEAANAMLYSDRTTFLPTQRQKNSAQNAVMLLSLMAIPQIDVDLADGTVKDAQGQEIAIFIDFIPATSEDLSGMQTTDVKKVECLLSPTDPRFHGEKYVLNFVMQKYEWGGYTKLMAYGTFLKNRAKASTYSKMNYRNLTFDIYADEYYKSGRHGGTSSREIFNFTNLYGEGPKDIERTEMPLDARYDSNHTNLSLRAVYSGDKIQAANRLSATCTRTPHDDIAAELTYSPELEPGGVADNRRNNNNLAVHYNLDLYSAISRNVTFSTRGWYVFGKNNAYSDYTAGDEAPIINIAEETSHHFQLYPTLDWSPARKHTFTFLAGTVHSWNDIDYSGNSPSAQTFNLGGYGVDAGYQLSLPTLTVGADIAWFWQHNKISGFEAANSSPQINFFASYSPASKHQLRGSFFYGEEIPLASQKSPNILRQDRLIYYCGNPGLGDYTRINTNISYLFLPSHSWQISLNGFINIVKNQCVPVYSPTGPGGAMLRQYFNAVDVRNGCLRTGVTGKFLNGSLIVKAQPQLWIRRSSGEYAWRHNELACKVEMQYYLGNCYFLAWYATPGKHQGDNGAVISTPSQYQLQAGWSCGAWNISAYAFNAFRRSWEERHESLTSRYYSFDRRVFGDGNHACYNLSLTYTFGYGKKVTRDGEMGGAGSASSAILK